MFYTDVLFPFCYRLAYDTICTIVENIININSTFSYIVMNLVLFVWYYNDAMYSYDISKFNININTLTIIMDSSAFEHQYKVKI